MNIGALSPSLSSSPSLWVLIEKDRAGGGGGERESETTKENEIVTWPVVEPAVVVVVPPTHRVCVHINIASAVSEVAGTSLSVVRAKYCSQ